MNKWTSALLLLVLLSASGYSAEDKYTDSWITKHKTFVTDRFNKRIQWLKEDFQAREDYANKVLQSTLDHYNKALSDNQAFMDHLRSVPLDQRKNEIQQQTLKETTEQQDFQSQQQIERSDFDRGQKEKQLQFMKAEHETDADELRDEQQLMR